MFYQTFGDLGEKRRSIEHTQVHQCFADSTDLIDVKANLFRLGNMLGIAFLFFERA
jgi:hypothetical protein